MVKQTISASKPQLLEGKLIRDPCFIMHQIWDMRFYHNFNKKILFNFFIKDVKKNSCVKFDAFSRQNRSSIFFSKRRDSIILRNWYTTDLNILTESISDIVYALILTFYLFRSYDNINEYTGGWQNDANNWYSYKVFPLFYPLPVLHLMKISWFIKDV